MSVKFISVPQKEERRDDLSLFAFLKSPYTFNKIDQVHHSYDCLGINSRYLSICQIEKLSQVANIIPKLVKCHAVFRAT